MFSKLSFSISFSQLLRSHEHKTLSTVSFSFASDANYGAFPLMSPERGFEDTHTHTHTHMLSLTHPLTHPHTQTNVHAHKNKQTDNSPHRHHTLSRKHTHTHTYKIAAVHSNYGREEPLISWGVVSASHHSVFVSPLLFPCGKTQLFTHFPGSHG